MLNQDGAQYSAVDLIRLVGKIRIDLSNYFINQTMSIQNLDQLRIFLLVAETGSFTKTAAQIGTSQSAVSYTMRQLEERLKVKLLERTTRSVSTTTAGEQLRQQITPLLSELEQKLTNLNQFRQQLSGRLRLTGNEHAFVYALWPKLKAFMQAHPEIELELDSSNRFTDIVAERFDAGVRLGQFVEKDMIAQRISADLQMVLVASPDYLQKHPALNSPFDLTEHRCIALRLPTLNNLLAWEFCDPKRDKVIKIQPSAELVCNQNSLLLTSARAGLGITWLPKDMVQQDLAQQTLCELLPEWAISYPGYYLYYPSRKADSSLFQALLAELRE